MARGFTGIVVTVLRKLDAETMIGATMQSGDESFHHLTRNQVNLIQIAPLLYIGQVFRDVGPGNVTGWLPVLLPKHP